MAKTALTYLLDGVPDSAKARLSKALLPLADARSYADALKKTPWEFAITIKELRDLALTSADIRFLVLIEFLLVGKGRKSSSCHSNSHHRLKLPPDDAQVILSEAGLAAIRYRLHGPRSTTVLAAAAKGAPQEYEAEAAHIRFCAEKRELFVDGALIKRFPASARNQLAVLMGFQEKSWESRIANPIRSSANKARSQQLRDAVYGLNANQTPRRICFHSDEKGRAIWYEFS